MLLDQFNGQHAVAFFSSQFFFSSISTMQRHESPINFTETTSPLAMASGTKRPHCWFQHEFKKEEDSVNAAGDEEELAIMVMKMIDAGFVVGMGYVGEIYYMLIPVEVNITVCEPVNVGRGSRYYEVDDATVAAVYVLAKNQYLAEKGSEEEDAIKFAVLRTEMFKAGWFDNQMQCKFMPTPDNFLAIFAADAEKTKPHFLSASQLCSFVPFMQEFYFRTYASHYNSHTAAEFMRKAGKFAAVSHLCECMNYMQEDIIFGPAFRWIGVKRSRDVLLANLEEPSRIHEVFRVRAKHAPAGQAFITSTYAVIKSVQADLWWEPICRAEGFKDEVLIKVAEKILEQPWKYHMCRMEYDEAPLSDHELKEVEDAKNLAILFVPFTQAYCDVILLRERKSVLGRIKTIKRHASANPIIYKWAIGLFRDLSRRRRCKATPIDEILAKHY